MTDHYEYEYEEEVLDICPDWGDRYFEELTFDVPDVDFEYEEQDDEGCEGGACRI